MDAILFRRLVPNVRLLTEQIQLHDVTQKMVANVPEELLTLLAHSTTRRHIKKLGNHERHSSQNFQTTTFYFIFSRYSYL